MDAEGGGEISSRFGDVMYELVMVERACLLSSVRGGGVVISREEAAKDMRRGPACSVYSTIASLKVY